MLEPPGYNTFLLFLGSLIANGLFGFITSIPGFWFPNGQNAPVIGGVYLKAGEYGESEHPQSWSVFKEPFNAWTSLAYSVFGVVIFSTGLLDMVFGQYYGGATNIIIENPLFSLFYGGSSIYLGIASYLFHASHSEIWRKADAGMTSGVMIPLIMIGIWDRARPPGLSSFYMCILGLILQLSLTHGYLPYGSSDILLPSLIILTWSFELLPRYGGPVDQEEYFYWLQCFYACFGGMLLRLADVKRKNKSFFLNVLGIFLFISFIPFGYFSLGLTHPLILLGLFSCLIVYKSPSTGHIFWHFGSAYSIFIWWALLRLRPGNPLTIHGNDWKILNVLFFVCVKNAIRRLCMMLPTNPLSLIIQTPTLSTSSSSSSSTSTFPLKELSHKHNLQNNNNNNNNHQQHESSTSTSTSSTSSSEHGDIRYRLLFLFEHIFFSIWGYQVLISEPPLSENWFYNTKNIWTLPIFPLESFHLYYVMKVGFYVEDLIEMSVMIVLTYLRKKSSISTSTSDLNFSSESDQENNLKQTHLSSSPLSSSNSPPPPLPPPPRDLAMNIHHLVTALLCIASYLTGFAKIGSLVMLLHDMSDVPLDLIRLFGVLNWKTCQYVSFVWTLLAWMYWRLWYFPTSILRSVYYESKSMWNLSLASSSSSSSSSSTTSTSSLLANSYYLSPTSLTCEIGSCTNADIPERMPFFLLLFVLQVLHFYWFYLLVKKGFGSLFSLSSSTKKQSN